MSEWEAVANRAQARSLVMVYGWNTTAYQILNPGFEYWFAPEAAAVVAYTRRRNVMLVAGAPVCAAEALSEAAAGFEQFASAQGCRVCYVCAADRLRNTMTESNRHSVIVIGAQPVWNPQHWRRMTAGRQSIQRQIARARTRA